jgi:CubicO group peptidase (beta-lactamase class C family)
MMNGKESYPLADRELGCQTRRGWLHGSLLKAAGLPLLGEAALAPSRLLASTEGWPAERWPTATPQSVGLDAEKLAEFDAEIAAGKFGYVDSLLVIRHGKAVYDRSYKNDYDKIYGKEARESGPLNPHDHGGPYNYFNPWWHPFYRRGDLHTMQSVTKTVTSVTIGAARARGEFPALDTPILKYFDEKKVANLDERKRRMTIRHLLTMTAGFEWNEGLPYDDPKNSCSLMEASFDWVKFTVDQPMFEEPGTRFNYNSGATQLLSRIFRATAGQDIEEYAAGRLFTPLGISQYFWKRTPTGLADTEGGLYLRAHDLARIAYLFLKNGVWDGKPIVAPDWVKESVAPAISVSNNGVKYGLKWWLYPYGPKDPRLAWAGAGFGGQMPIVIPEYDLVIVVTGWNILPGKNRKFLSHRVLIDRVLAAVRV